MKELRIDFPDYSAKEQERDAMRSCFRQVYLMKVDGKWAHYTIIDNKEDYGSHNQNLTETFYELKAQFPQHKIKVIRNEGLENYLRDMLPRKQKIDKLQLKINFSEGR